MTFRIHPVWWPIAAVLTPVLTPILLSRNRRFKNNRDRANKVNAQRIDKAGLLDLPQLEYLNVTVLSEWATEEGFIGEPGVSYLFRTNLGTLLFDLGYGSARPTLVHNATKLGILIDQVDALAISHLHLDHMGGMKSQRNKLIAVPRELGSPRGKTCFLPVEAKADDFNTEVATEPRVLAAGIASTGPLARSLFFFGMTEEQALVARVKDKGLVIFTGCGHPTIEVILRMVRRLSREPIYAIGGGLHFPITSGRGNYKGIQPQMIFGSDRPPWQPLKDSDLSNAIDIINKIGPKKVLLSAHDTCDYALKRFMNELQADTKILKAGATYQL